MNLYLFLSYWLVNSLVFYLFNTLFPSHVAVGTHQISYFEGLAFSGFWMSFLFWAMWEFFKERKLGIESPFWALAFLSLLNAISVWTVARFAPLTGLGISSFFWAIIIGTVANIFHLFLWTDYSKK